MNRVRAVLPGVLTMAVVLLPQVAGAQLAPPPPPPEIQGADVLPALLQPALPGNKIPQFVNKLPVLGTDIPVLLDAKVTLSTCEYEQSILPTGTPLVGNPGAKTWVWGYRAGDCNATIPGSYVGPVIVATRGTPTQVTYDNQLPTAAATKVVAYKQGTDQTLLWADPANATAAENSISSKLGPSELNFCNTWAKESPGVAPPVGSGCENHYSGQVAAAPHLHGGEIPAMLDGGPDAWWTRDGRKGHGYYTYRATDVEPTASQAIYRYPNGQEAAPIWFHDHTLGATRLNVYAGIAGAYMIIEPDKTPAGMTPVGLPNGTNVLGKPELGELLIPVVIQDRMFDVNGQLLFPNVGINPDHPFWIPEFVGDTIVVNGRAWPTHTVEPKRYRVLFLNGSNARAYELYLVDKTTGVKGPAMHVIGTDQGYLDRPATIDPNVKPNNVLVIMPGERYEAIIDFSAFAPGTRLLLANSAKTPYPDGGPVIGRTTGRIMEFVIGSCTSGKCGAADTSYDPASGADIRTADKENVIQRLANPVSGTPAAPVIHKVRRLTLNEAMGVTGAPVEVLVNNTPYTGAERQKWGLTDFMPVTTEWNTSYYSEVPHEGETELWEIVNLTADAHPIHPHLVGFQVLNRQAFDLKGYDALYNASFPGMVYIPGYGPPADYNCLGGVPGRGILNPDPAAGGCTLGGNPDVTPFLRGAPLPPKPSEAGWKDTVVALPGQVTRFLVRFAPTTLANDTEADSADAAYEFDPDDGHGFVWHCHIIDHEDNEMMRPMGVIRNPFALPADKRKHVIGEHY